MLPIQGIKKIIFLFKIPSVKCNNSHETKMDVVRAEFFALAFYSCIFVLYLVYFGVLWIKSYLANSQNVEELSKKG